MLHPVPRQIQPDGTPPSLPELWKRLLLSVRITIRSLIFSYFDEESESLHWKSPIQEKTR
jgi:hypothetical protein